MNQSLPVDHGSLPYHLWGWHQYKISSILIDTDLWSWEIDYLKQTWSSLGSHLDLWPAQPLTRNDLLYNQMFVDVLFGRSEVIALVRGDLGAAVASILLQQLNITCWVIRWLAGGLKFMFQFFPPSDDHDDLRALWVVWNQVKWLADRPAADQKGSFRTLWSWLMVSSTFFKVYLTRIAKIFSMYSPVMVPPSCKVSLKAVKNLIDYSCIMYIYQKP